MAEETKESTKPCADEICHDKEILKQKGKMLDRQKWTSAFSFASGITGMFGGPLLGAGLFGLLAVLGASQGMIPALIVIGVGATMSLAGMAVNYFQNKNWHDIDFDRMELAATRNAKHLVQELKANNMTIVEHSQNARSDGKTWVKATNKEQAQPQLQPQPT